MKYSDDVAGEIIFLGSGWACVWPPRECSVCHTARAFGYLEAGPGGNRFICMLDYEPGEGGGASSVGSPRVSNSSPAYTEPSKMVPVWWDEEGHALCKECAADARIWGQQRVVSTRVPAARFECEYCHEAIK